MIKPKEIDTGFKISEPLIWALDLPTETINIDEISYNLVIPYLEHENTDDWNLSINSLITDFDSEPHHAEQVRNADTSYPIDLYYFRNKWIILDGVHRLTKIVMSGQKTVKIRRIPQEDIDRLVASL